jgi:hypothetical protein
MDRLSPNPVTPEPPRVPWESRLADVEHAYPSTTEAWAPALHDYEMMGRIIRDILRVGSAPKRRGQRPLPDADAGMIELRRLWGEDYSTLPFADTFRLLGGARSRTHMARKTGLARSRVHRLWSGEIVASGGEMEQIARAFDKTPGYFLEYRVGVVCAAIAEHLRRAPEASIGPARDLGVY